MATAPIPPEAIISAPGTKTVETAEGVWIYAILPQKEPVSAGSFVLSIVGQAAGGSPEGRPTSLLFGALRDPHLKLRKPIPLKIEESEGLVSAIFEDIQEFGCGKNMSDALSDFSSTVAELYVRLSQENAPLGVDLLRVKTILSDYIEPRPR
ncbi:MAG: hypothetical protein ABSF45_11735 [Terriglobia bacterium]|jgi:hypothetical protein